MLKLPTHQLTNYLSGEFNQKGKRFIAQSVKENVKTKSRKISQGEIPHPLLISRHPVGTQAQKKSSKANAFNDLGGGSDGTRTCQKSVLTCPITVYYSGLRCKHVLHYPIQSRPVWHTAGTRVPKAMAPGVSRILGLGCSLSSSRSTHHHRRG